MKGEVARWQTTTKNERKKESAFPLRNPFFVAPITSKRLLRKLGKYLVLRLVLLLLLLHCIWIEMPTENTSVSLRYKRSADLLKSAQHNQKTRQNKNFRNNCFLFAVIDFFFFFTIKHLCKLAVGLNPTFGLLDPSSPAGV